MPGYRMQPYSRAASPRGRRLPHCPPTRAMILTEEKAAPIFADEPRKWVIRNAAITSSRLPQRIAVAVGSRLLGEVTVTECMAVPAHKVIDPETEASYDDEAWYQLLCILQSEHYRVPHIYRLCDPTRYDPPRPIKRKAGQSSWAVL